MGFITNTRDELVAALEGVDDDVKVTGFVPERLNPPALMVVHGSPLAEQGEQYGTKRVRFEVWTVSRLAANARQTDQLDDLLEATVDALEADDWGVEQIGQPFAYQVGNATFLTATITTTATVATN